MATYGITASAMRGAAPRPTYYEESYGNLSAQWMMERYGCKRWTVGGLIRHAIVNSNLMLKYFAIPQSLIDVCNIREGLFAICPT